MALIKATLKTAIQTAMIDQYDGTPSSEQTTGISNFADDLATAIDDYIKSALITIPIGTIITVGSPTTQTQSVPGIVTGGLS